MENTYEFNRDSDWQHKLHLDSLSTFSEQLNYWKYEVRKDGFVSGREYTDEPSFTLTLEPKTDDDRRELFQYQLDWWRERFANQEEPVYEFGFTEGIKRIAYTLRLLSTLKIDLEKRLFNAVRKEDLLKQELADVTQRINKVAKTINGYSSIHGQLVEDLRFCLETNRAYDFLFVKQNDPGSAEIKLAMVWDIVYFEAYLKDQIELVKNGFSSLIMENIGTDGNFETPSSAMYGTINIETSKQISIVSDEEIKQKIRLVLAPLNGFNPQKQKIMNKEDFDKLVKYTDFLVINDALPTEITPISQTNISNEHIRYTFYRLHKQLFGTIRKRPSFIAFIHAVFTQFSGTSETTTNSKFSTAPRSYEKDFAGYIGEVT